MRLSVYGEPRSGWGGMCVENLVGFVGREMFMAFKMKMEGIEGVGEGSMVRDTGWMGWVLVPNEGELENRKNMGNLSDGGKKVTC